MLNYSFVKKNETKPDNMGNMENSSSLETVLVINCILNAPLMLTSITGNALVLAAMLRTPSLRSVPSTVFLCSLASTDFLVGLVVQPVYIAIELRYLTGEFIFKAIVSMSTCLCGVSLATITAISVDRLLALHYHMTYPNLMTTKRALYASASLWFVSILLPCVTVWKWRVFDLMENCILQFVLSFHPLLTSKFISLFVTIRSRFALINKL